VRFEILRLDLDHASETERDPLIADAETVRAMLEDAELTGQRLYIRPAPSTAAGAV
jgi:hypothetical protein